MSHTSGEEIHKKLVKTPSSSFDLCIDPQASLKRPTKASHGKVISNTTIKESAVLNIHSGPK